MTVQPKDNAEAIKGQNALKLAVEKLEAEIFKDWPTKRISQNATGVVLGGCHSCIFTGATIINTPKGAYNLIGIT